MRTDLRIINTGDKPFDFTAALHTYIEVLDNKKASVKGLKDLEYLDKVTQQMTCFTQFAAPDVLYFSCERLCESSTPGKTATAV